MILLGIILYMFRGFTIQFQIHNSLMSTHQLIKHFISTEQYIAKQSQFFPYIEVVLFLSTLLLARGIDVIKRTVTTHFYNVLQGIRYGHNMTSYAYFLSLLLATSWRQLIFSVNYKFFR